MLPDQARQAHPDIVRPPDEAQGQGWEAIVADDHILLSAVYLAQTRTGDLHGKHAVVRPACPCQERPGQAAESIPYMHALYLFYSR